MANSSSISEISDTAFWVSRYRAEESQRKDALFKDPLALQLSGEKGKRIAQQASDSKYAGWTVVVRTCVIDKMILNMTERGVQQVLNLGAGLDTRPYRMTLPESLQWIEVDHPHVIQYKKQVLDSEVPTCQLQRVGLDLADRAARKAFLSDLGSNKRTLVLTEGVIPYLTESQVSELAEDLISCKAVESWVAEYHSKQMYGHLNNVKKTKQMGQSPFQFFPEDWYSFFEDCGWKERETIFLGEAAKDLGRPFPLPFWAKALHALMPKQELEKLQKMSGFVVFQRG